MHVTNNDRTFFTNDGMAMSWDFLAIFSVGLEEVNYF